jgi:hypothetical protein
MAWWNTDDGGWIGSLSRALGIQEPLKKGPPPPVGVPQGGGGRDWGPVTTTRSANPADINGSFGRYRNQAMAGALSGSGAPNIADILTQLQGLQDPSRYLADNDTLNRQARFSANAQYDPAIEMLRQEMTAAQERGARNKNQIGNMYQSLSRDIESDIPEIAARFGQSRARTDTGYDNLRSQIDTTYADVQADQEELLKRLNIEAAAPDMLKDQGRDRAYFQNMAGQNAQVMDDALALEQTGATEFTQKGSQLARVEGTNRQADLMTQLEDMLRQYSGQISAQEIARENSYQSALAELMGQNQSQASERAQRDFENYIKVTELGRGLRSDELKALTERGGATSVVKSPADVPARALNLGLDQNAAQRLQNVFSSTVLSDPVITAGIDPTYGTALSKEALAQRLVEAGRASGLSQQEVNALQAIALEYFGRR